MVPEHVAGVGGEGIMKRALVTGATGMLGSYVVERLVAEGWQVRAMVRRPERAAWLRDLGADLVPGDLTDAESVRRAVDDCDGVIHAAAAIGSGSGWDAFRAGNVDGTRAVVDAAADVGARLVHVSSTSVFGAARYHTTPTDELVPLPELPKRDAYGRSKQLAELLVLNGHLAGRVWAAVVRPPVMYGKRDRQFAPRVAPLLLKGLFPLIGGGRTTLTLVHADAVALGAVRALESDLAGGRVYHLTNDFDVTAEDLVRGASVGLGIRIRAPAVPVPLGRAGFGLLGLALLATGRWDLVPHAAGTFRMLTRDNPFTSRRARTELGWTPTIRPEQGLPEAFRWWASRAQSTQRELRVGGRHERALG